MITPLQRSAGAAATDMMRSMVQNIEEKHREEQDKVNGIKRDEPVATKSTVVPSDVHHIANEKISSYLFGTMKQDGDPFATLVSRLSSALGVTQEADESNFAFAGRLKDAMALMDFEKSDMFGKPVNVTLETLKVSENDVKSVLAGEVRKDTPEMAKLAARYAERIGLKGSEEDFSNLLSSALTSARAAMPETVDELEEMTGLSELGISADTLIQAIANPWGEAAIGIKQKLKDEAANQAVMTAETIKTLQRLEDVADPKTKEELVAERGKNRIGEINDSEVEAERTQDIQNTEAQSKLDDVQKIQDVVKEHLDTSAENTGEVSVDSDSKMMMIQVLAATQSSGEISDDPTSESDFEPLQLSTSRNNEQIDDAEEFLVTQKLLSNGEKGIFPISADENGIYELLNKKAA